MEQPASEILVSIAFPTRGRPEKLKAFIASVVATVSNPKQVEFVFRVDDDDVLVINALHEISKNCPIAIRWDSKPRYSGSFVWMFAQLFQECCEMARGRWIYQLEDDCLIEPESIGWDEKLATVKLERIILTGEANIYNSQRVTWNGQPGQWHAGHFIIMPNRWWESYGLRGIPPPVDTATLNILVGAGWRGQPPGMGWHIHTISGLVTRHDQIPDAVFHQRNRKSFAEDFQ